MSIDHNRDDHAEGPHVTRLLGADGIELCADVWEPADAPETPDVLFLHGAGQTRKAWGSAAAAVAADGHHVVAYDHRGHGDSDWSATGAYEVDAYAADLAAVVDALDAPPVVVGASLGGVAALVAQVAAEAQLFSGVVLVDTAPRMDQEGVERILGFMAAHPDGFASLDAAADAIADYLPHRERTRDLDGLRKVLRRTADGRWRWHWSRVCSNRASKCCRTEPCARSRAGSTASSRS